MRNTSIHLPALYLKLIDEIICEKDYPCTSEFVRIAIRKLLKRDTLLLRNPRLEQTSEQIKGLIAKQKMAGLQKSLDQFRLILNQNTAIQKSEKLSTEFMKKKQARIDSFWK